MRLSDIHMQALREADTDYVHRARHEDEDNPSPMGYRQIDVHAQFDMLEGAGLLRLEPYKDTGGSGLRYVLTDAGREALKGGT